jgi:hypothetical protein
VKAYIHKARLERPARDRRYLITKTGKFMTSEKTKEDKYFYFQACSTCHLIFKPEDYAKLPETPTDEELDMLVS